MLSKFVSKVTAFSSFAFTANSSSSSDVITNGEALPALVDVRMFANLRSVMSLLVVSCRFMPFRSSSAAFIAMPVCVESTMSMSSLVVFSTSSITFLTTLSICSWLNWRALIDLPWSTMFFFIVLTSDAEAQPKMDPIMSPVQDSGAPPSTSE